MIATRRSAVSACHLLGALFHFIIRHADVVDIGFVDGRRRIGNGGRQVVCLVTELNKQQPLGASADHTIELKPSRVDRE
jgi:hypothetical protein